MPRMIVAMGLSVVTRVIRARSAACRPFATAAWAVGSIALVAGAAAPRAAHAACPNAVRHDALLEMSDAGRWGTPSPVVSSSAASSAERFALAHTQCGQLALAATRMRVVQDTDTAASPPRESQLLSMYEPLQAAPRAESAVAPAAALPGTSASASDRSPFAGAEAAVPSRQPDRADAAQSRPAARSSDRSSLAMRQRVRALAGPIAEAARRHRLDPLLLHAVAHVESRHDTRARSPAGALGVMQVMPGTARRFGVIDPARSLHHGGLNLDVGAAYLATLKRRFGNDLPLVLAAYNAGEGAVERHGNRIPPYPETRAYVKNVLDTYAQLRGATRNARVLAAQGAAR